MKQYEGPYDFHSEEELPQLEKKLREIKAGGGTKRTPGGLRSSLCVPRARCDASPNVQMQAYPLSTAGHHCFSRRRQGANIAHGTKAVGKFEMALDLVEEDPYSRRASLCWWLLRACGVFAEFIVVLLSA